MRVCVCVCVCMCVCVCVRARALSIVSTDKILCFINTLIIIVWFLQAQNIVDEIFAAKRGQSRVSSGG